MRYKYKLGRLTLSLSAHLMLFIPLQCYKLAAPSLKMTTLGKFKMILMTSGVQNFNLAYFLHM
jgi:hypothetical protein